MDNNVSKNQYIMDILFTKEMIKTLEDTVMDYLSVKTFWAFTTFS